MNFSAHYKSANGYRFVLCLNNAGDHQSFYIEEFSDLERKKNHVHKFRSYLFLEVFCQQFQPEEGCKWEIDFTDDMFKKARADQ